MLGFGFRVSSFECWVLDLGVRVWGGYLGCRVDVDVNAVTLLGGLEFTIIGFRFQGLGFRAKGLGVRVQALGFRVQGLGFML